MKHNFDRYGKPSIKMLKFLYHNPASTSREINDHLYGDRTVNQKLIRYTYVDFHNVTKSRTSWTSDPSWYGKSDYYTVEEVISERTILISKLCRGKYAYLLSPYHSRTLAADISGSRAHDGVANRGSQRCWFYRKKGTGGLYQYFLTLRGMGAYGELMEREKNAE